MTRKLITKVILVACFQLGIQVVSISNCVCDIDTVSDSIDRFAFKSTLKKEISSKISSSDSISQNDRALESLVDVVNSFLAKDQADSAISIINEELIFNNKGISNNGICDIYYLKGIALYKKRLLTEAVNCFQKAFEDALLLNYDSIRILSLKSIGNVNYLQGKYENALSYYRESLGLINTGDNSFKTVTSSLYQNIGISLAMLGENDSAFYYVRQSLKLKEQILPQRDPMLASGYLNFSRLLQVNGELNEALDNIEKAENIYFSLYGDQNVILAPLYLNKGSVLITLNEYESALHYHELALALYKSEYKHDDEIFNLLYLNFGAIYKYLERYSEAVKYFKLSLNDSISNEHLVKSNFLLGSVLLQLGHIEDSYNHLLNAVKISERELGPNNVLTANSYLNYGIYCEQINKKDTALVFYNKAASIFRNIYGDKNRDLSNTYSLIGNLFNDYRNPWKALESFQNSLTTFIKEFDEPSIYVNPNEGLLESDLNLFFTLSGKARAFYSYYLEESQDLCNLEACLLTSEIAIYLLEKIKATLQGENTKLLVNSRASEVYHIAVKAASELYGITCRTEYLEKSLKFSEKSKGAILLSTIKEFEALQIGNLPDVIKREEKLKKRAIAQYKNTIYEESQKSPIDSSKVSRLRNRLLGAKLFYDSLILSIELNYPEYYNLKYNFDVISISQIQEKLEEGQAFIEYKLTDSILFTFIVKNDSALMVKKNVGTSFSEKINQYLELINHYPKTDSVKYRSYSFAKLGVELTNLLELNNPVLSNCEKLILIPDDVLGYLSFDALITNLPDENASRYDKLEYLIYKYSLSYGYSGTLFFKGGRKNKGNNKVLAIAPSYENVSNGQYAQMNSSVRDIEKYLIPLPNTVEEVNSISAIFNGAQQIGMDATETKFKSTATDYSILHFAMHTLINDEDPLASKLVFALNDDSINDGFLNTYEIYNLELNAELAVLSACKTGAGKMSKGEGIMSLARGFLFAGVPGIVMTLWAVEDISGAEIIKSFYENLYAGQKKDMALRNAKLSYLSNSDPARSHPYFWAAYVQIGNNSSITLPVISIYYYALAGALSFIIIVVAIVRIRRTRIKKMQA